MGVVQCYKLLTLPTLLTLLKEWHILLYGWRMKSYNNIDVGHYIVIGLGAKRGLDGCKSGRGIILYFQLEKRR